MSKGRDKALISARDRKLFERYYYWTEVKRLRFDDALQKLSSEEFFISEGRIMQIIRKMIREGEKVDGVSAVFAYHRKRNATCGNFHFFRDNGL